MVWLLVCERFRRPRRRLRFRSCGVRGVVTARLSMSTQPMLLGGSDAEISRVPTYRRRCSARAGPGLADETVTGSSGPSGVKVTGMRMGPLMDALSSIHTWLGFGEATGSDEVFYQQVIARLVEPTSKYDSLWVLEEIGLGPVSYATVKRRLPRYAAKELQAEPSRPLAARADLGTHALVLFDVSTL